MNLLSIKLVSAHGLFRHSKLADLLMSLTASSNIRFVARKIGYSRMQAWRLAKRISWLIDDKYLAGDALLLNFYDKRFDSILRYAAIRPIIRCLAEFGPLHIRDLSRFLQINHRLVVLATKELERSELVSRQHRGRGRRTLIALLSSVGPSNNCPERLVPRTLSPLVASLASSLKASNLQTFIRCLVLAYNLDSKTGKIFAIPSNSKEETLDGVHNLLTGCVDRAPPILGIDELYIVNRAAWLRQLLRMAKFSQELEEAFDSPPVFGGKPVPNQLYDALLTETEPPTSSQIESWLKRSLITPTPRGYMFTPRGLHAIRIRGRLHLRPQREILTAGKRKLHLILS